MRTSCFKPTNEDWHPSYKFDKAYKCLENQQFLEVTCCALSNNEFRTMVWGADDTGMEKDCKTKEEAIEIYNEIVKRPSITRSYLKSLGLYPA